MAKSDARFEYRAKQNRDVHNLGEPFGFTCAAGQLLPCFEDIATPGDTYYIKHDLEFLRTLPLAAPAMCDVKVHLESFFVPFQMIYQPFEETLFSLKTPQSSNFELSGLKGNSFPVGNFSDLRTNEYGGTSKHSKARFDAFRLSDMLGMNAYAYAFDTNYPSIFAYCPNVFPWALLAYHTIFQYFYRLDDKTQFANDWANWDFWYNATSAVNLSVGIHEIHQRPWDFDYFTSSYRSPIVSSNNTQDILPANVYSDLFTNVTTFGSKVDGNGGGPNDTIVGFSSVVSSPFDPLSVRTSISTASIRQMFANEKLAMITGRARKTYDAQVLAHFGVEVPHDPKHDIAFIGRDTYDINIGEVTSLSSTTSAGLGDLAGKGWSVGKSKGHKFTAPCHGVVMTIFSVEPKKRYFGEYNRIYALTDAFDLPTPEYDRLGNMPMFRFETGERNGSGTVTDTDIVAWKERYYWNKHRHPKASLAFMNNRPVTLGYNDKSSYMITSAPFGAYTGTNNNTARPDLESRYYIDTNCMDALLLQPYIGIWQNGETGEETSENWNKTPWLAYSRDPFIVSLDMKVKKVSWMSKDGEPIYNF